MSDKDKQAKVCTKCNKLKVITDFYFQKDRNSYYSACKICKNNKNSIYYLKNKKEINLRHKNYDITNKEQIKKYKKQYCLANKKRRSVYNKQYFLKNKEQRMQYKYKKRKIDINYRLADTLRSRLHKALKNEYKAGSAVRDLGCSIQELKDYLEKQFKTGMTWNNWSYVGWHIDHIKPLASFNLSNRKQFLEANNYSNLQPLWSEDNMVKGSKC